MMRLSLEVSLSNGQAFGPNVEMHLASPRMSEIVLKTSNLDRMQQWYQLVLSAEPTFEYEHDESQQVPGKVDNFRRLCFLRLYAEFPYTQVIAIFELSDLVNNENALGLHHMQFKEASIGHLVDRYEMLARHGITPYQSFNHGPATSFYYEDPDKNLVELSGANFETEAEYRAFFKTPAFSKNPTGIEISDTDFVRRYRAGLDIRELVRLPD